MRPFPRGATPLPARIPPAHRRERGAATVEFALVLPVLLMLVFGIIDFGRAYSQQVQLSQLAREGARLASLGSTDVTSRLLSAASPSLHLTAASIAQVPCTANATQGTDASVTLAISYTWITPVAAVAHLAPGPLTLRAKATMPCLG